MTRTISAHEAAALLSDPVQGDDVRRILGGIDDSTLIEILNLRPTLAEVEEAAVWANGDGDILAKAGRRQTGVVARLVEILTAGEEEPEPR